LWWPFHWYNTATICSCSRITLYPPLSSAPTLPSAPPFLSSAPPTTGLLIFLAFWHPTTTWTFKRPPSETTRGAIVSPKLLGRSANFRRRHLLLPDLLNRSPCQQNPQCLSTTVAQCLAQRSQQATVDIAGCHRRYLST
jgi:hypothetical protein